MAVISRLISAGHTDVGRKRVENEDRILMDPQRGIYLVVDGIGGHAAGERAARVAADIISMRLARQTGSTVKRVQEAFALASTEIFETASRDSGLTGMACVATLAIIEDDRVTVGHVGDSRLYLLEPGTIRKVTHDHSPVGEREDAGELTEDAAMFHPRRNEVYRDLGSFPHGPDDADFVEIQQFDLPPSSALLLCSDGLTDQVPAEEIRQLVEKHAGDPESGTRALITAANQAGGKDNVSVVLVETPQYAVLVEHPQAATRRHAAPGRGLFVIGLLAGLLVAAGVFAALRPYLELVASKRVLRFGTVKPPRILTVGPAVGPDAFQTISAALEQARPGDTISVSPGEYHENLSLRNGVSVISTELHGARLSGLSTSGVIVVADNVHHARFSGFDILGPAEGGMRLSNADVDIAGVRISGMQGAGLEIDGGQSGFQASTVEENAGAGIYVHGAASPRIDHNTIVNNGHAVELAPGVYIAGTATPHLFGNLITNNGAEQVWVSPLYNAGNLLKDNVIAATLREGSNHDIKVVTR